jgi:hypothetical protein
MLHFGISPLTAERISSKTFWFSVCHFVTLPLCHFVSLSLCRFVILSFCQFVSLSVCHFVSLSLCQFVTLPLYHFVSLSFSQFFSFSVLQFVVEDSCPRGHDFESRPCCRDHLSCTINLDQKHES